MMNRFEKVGRLLIILQFLAAAFGFCAEPELLQAGKVLKSPNGQFYCGIESREGGGYKAFIVPDSRSNQKVFAGITERQFGVEWSKDSKFLAITNYMDGHITTIEIFGFHLIDAKSKTFGVEKVYATPWPGRYDQYWSLLSWQLKKGEVKLKCRFRKESEIGEGDWAEGSYEVPICLK